jgi:2-dehydro-3-deoxy-D-gluconate 5-dehydrogenase
VHALGRRAEVLAADAGRMADVRGLVGRVLQVFPHIDILVNVAGTNRRKPAVEITEDDWDLVLDVNLKAAFFVTQAVGRYWIESGRFADGRHGKGKVLNVTSLTSVIGIRNVAPYAASKSGLLGITRVLALEWAPHHICVNGLAPGYIRTALTRPLFDDPGYSAWIHSRIPTGQAGTPSDLVGAAVFLAAPASDYLTGQNLAVDGGWLAG